MDLDLSQYSTITDDSRKVRPGSLFCAYFGEKCVMVEYVTAFANNPSEPIEKYNYGYSKCDNDNYLVGPSNGKAIDANNQIGYVNGFWCC